MAGIIEDYYASWGGTDPDAVVAFMTDDVEFEDVTMKEAHQGKDRVRRFVAACFKVVPGVKYEIVASRVSDETYWVEWVMQPQGLRGASVGLLRDGKIAMNHDYWNGAEFKPGG